MAYMRRSHNTQRGVAKPFVDNRPLGLDLERRLDIRYKAGDLGRMAATLKASTRILGIREEPLTIHRNIVRLYALSETTEAKA